jgi:CRP-like cAMP-binding protein
VVDGSAEVDVDGTVVGHVQSGEGFGEVALLRRVPRTASVTATTQLTTLVVAQGDFMAFVAGNPASAASLRATTQDRELANRRTRGGLHRG